MADDPMDSPPRFDHGADRYDYVEINAPEGIQPHGEWWDRLLEEPCPDCRANVFANYDSSRESAIPWAIQIAHDETCPSVPK